MNACTLSFLAGVLAASAGQPVAPAGRSPAALVGAWALDTVRSHYGPGAERRRREHFTCAPDGRGGLRCALEAERADGRRVAGGFTAPPGGGPAPVEGVPGVDAVRVQAVSATIADATFYSRGAPVLGYRAYRAPDGRALVLVAVDPRSRAALTSVVVYARRWRRGAA